MKESKKEKHFVAGYKYLAVTTVVTIAVIIAAGCSSTSKNITESAGNKNLNLDGYVMFGKIEAANTETATPSGEMIMGRVTYKSRRVGIPADQKVPTTGYFKATQSESLFGTKDTIIEYDFTAGSKEDAAAALEALEKKKAEAEKLFTGNNADNASKDANNADNAQKDTEAVVETGNTETTAKTP